MRAGSHIITSTSSVMKTSGSLQEVLIFKTKDSIDTSKDRNSSPSQCTGGSVSYDRFRNPTESEESKQPGVDVELGQHSKYANGAEARKDGKTDQCNGASVIRVHPSATPSTIEAGIPEMYPRDADVLPTAILITCCCPVCGCMSISLAQKARRLREAGKYHASAQATQDSTWWAWSAALSGCFILLGLALSVMVFLLMLYV